MPYALIFKGKVCDLADAPFPAPPSMTWVDIAAVSPAPKIGTRYDGASFAAPGAVKTEAIRAEAERRLEQGALIAPGLRFKADTTSIARLHGMVKEAEMVEASGGSYSATFRLAAGVTKTIASAAEARALYVTVAGYVRAVLGASAAGQEAVGALDPQEADAYDPATGPAWPA